MAKTEEDMIDDQELDTFFDAARSQTPVPSKALMTAILADAATLQPTPPNIAKGATEPGRSEQGMWSIIVAAIGGWPALAGMTTATVAGAWIGFAAPTELETWSGGLVLSGSYGTEEQTFALEDLAPGYLGADYLTEEDE